MDRGRIGRKVFGALQEAMALDRAQTNLLRISGAGLVEMSRERVREDSCGFFANPVPAVKAAAIPKPRHPSATRSSGRSGARLFSKEKRSSSASIPTCGASLR